MSQTKSIISLVVRLAVGALFIKMGFDKVSNMAGTIAFFGSLGLAPVIAYAVAWIELVGGIAVLVGFYTKKVAAVLAVIMVGAMIYTSVAVLPAVTLVALCVLMYVGCGQYSVGYCMAKKSDAAVPPAATPTV